jgi:hypothetical protein
MWPTMAARSAITIRYYLWADDGPWRLPVRLYLQFVKLLSEIASLPSSWKERLREAKGIYLLTCPRTKEQYVGKAGGNEGILDRWQTHALLGGDAVRLKSREPSDYQVSILEVAGSGASEEDISKSEQLWIRKLQSVLMGLNGNPIQAAEHHIGIDSSR